MKSVFGILSWIYLLGMLGCGSTPNSHLSKSTPSIPGTSSSPQPTSPSSPSLTDIKASTTDVSSLDDPTYAQCSTKVLSAYQFHQTNLKAQLSKFKGFLHYLKGIPEGLGIRMQRAQMMIRFNRDFLNRLRVMENLADQCTVLHVHYMRYRTQLADDLGHHM
jgi:hypothetical protein